jgi:hypothetical protein
MHLHRGTGAHATTGELLLDFEYLLGSGPTRDGAPAVKIAVGVD